MSAKNSSKKASILIASFLIGAFTLLSLQSNNDDSIADNLNTASTVSLENPQASFAFLADSKCGGDAKKADEKKDAKSSGSKCGAGKCGGDAKKADEKKDAESSESKCGEGKCGGDAKKEEAKKEAKSSESKCGAGKCGGA